MPVAYTRRAEIQLLRFSAEEQEQVRAAVARYARHQLRRAPGQRPLGLLEVPLGLAWVRVVAFWRGPRTLVVVSVQRSEDVE